MVKEIIKVVRAYFKLRRREKYKSQFKPCSKDRTKLCPHRQWITERGGLNSDGLTFCCKFHESRIKMAKSIARCQAGVQYGEVSFTQNVIDSSKQTASRPIPNGPLKDVMEDYDD